MSVFASVFFVVLLALLSEYEYVAITVDPITGSLFPYLVSTNYVCFFITTVFNLASVEFYCQCERSPRARLK